jgi:hypothetical protein
MTPEVLSEFFEQHQNIEYRDDSQKREMHFRNTALPWYSDNDDRTTCVTYKKLHELSCEDLFKAINHGLEVENITRVTGYMSKVAGWNKGKRAELKDRNKMNLAGQLPSVEAA